MTQFTFSAEHPSQQYIQISAQFSVSGDETKVILPAWRPGRYEIANFAKNIKNFVIYNERKERLSFAKTSKAEWLVDTKGCEKITVQYFYYANVLNAGSSFLDDSQLYVNPVNCCVFTEETYQSEVEIVLNIPSNWLVATSLEKTNNGYKAKNIDELMDSPFICSGGLQHADYQSNGTTFHVWFNGEVKPDWERLLSDFQAFTDLQIKKFTEFPVKEYHFLIHILPYKTYHGVEHEKSTVISLGPSYDVFGKLYKELLGVSSHELYHTWNVKTIRPVEMYPYDFTRENYSRLGYIAEGITTYQGDLFLLKSGVFNEDQYLDELKAQFQKHFDNHGRFNYSVAESSFDTWLDGYEPGAPARKVSIYTEGCILAFVTDVRIRKATNNKSGLDEVMKRLYFNFALQQKGVSEPDYQSTIENLAGHSFQDFFDDYVNGSKPFESIITEALNYLGLQLVHNPSESYAQGRLGLKTTKAGDNFKVAAMYPGGPAELSGLTLGDEILAVNDYACAGELDKWFHYFDENPKKITVNRSGILKEFTFPEVNRNFYMQYNVERLENPNNFQTAAFNAWVK